MNENEIFKLIEKRISSIRERKHKPIRIAVNGIEGTGKTVFTKKLTKYLQAKGISAIQVSIDGFHFNKAIRYKQGRNSAKGYYENSYNEVSFVNKVLKSSQFDVPQITMATHDLESDQYLNLEPIELENDTILITDGAYLFKSIYRKYWDLKIYLKTSFKIAMSRGIERDKNLFGGIELAREKFENRYHESSKIYIKENEPESLANIIIDVSDFNNLKVIKS